jgi:tetratricopeptide (TPR) repeat protein
MIARRRLGVHHRDVAMVLKSMAQIHHERKRYSQAGALYEEALVVGRRGLASIRKSRVPWTNSATCCTKGGRLWPGYPDLQGRAWGRTVLDVFPPEHSCHSPTLVRFTRSVENYQNALHLYKEAIAIQRHSLEAHIEHYLRHLLPLPYPLPDS